MTRLDHLLVAMWEEADEVGQRISKALRFGLDEVQPGQLLTNRERIAEEMRDLNAIVRILAVDCGLSMRTLPTVQEYTAKGMKFDKYLEISKEQGRLALSEKELEPTIERLMEHGFTDRGVTTSMNAEHFHEECRILGFGWMRAHLGTTIRKWWIGAEPINPPRRMGDVAELIRILQLTADRS